MDVPAYLRNLISSYLQDRTLCYSSEKGNEQRNITAGVPQGSVLGPLLWNVMYDGILRIAVPAGATLVGFADDISVVVVAKSLRELALIAEKTIRTAQEWLNSKALVLATHKTEAVLRSSRKKVEGISIRVGDNIIESKPFIKYLGVIIDHRLCFREHADHANRKAASATTALSRIMANLAGPKQQSRKLLVSVVTSIILYGSTIWMDAFKRDSYVRNLKATYRRCALRVCSAFRTISEDAALVIAGLVPLDLLAEERKQLYQAKHGGSAMLTRPSNAELRGISITKWQRRWDEATTGRWTHRLVPDLKSWLERKHGEVDFYVTQLLSGHGCFKAYLHRFGHETDPICESCGVNAPQDAKHVFFECSNTLDIRQELNSTAGIAVTPDNIMHLMISSEDIWRAVGTMAAKVISRLRREEHVRRRREREAHRTDNTFTETTNSTVNLLDNASS